MSHDSHTPFRLSVTPDNLMIILHSLQLEDELSNLAAQLRMELAEIGVKGEMLPAIEELQQKIERCFAESGEIRDLKLIEGTAPVFSRNAQLKWTRDFFTEGYQTDPKTGRIDFRRRNAQPTVDEGELIATLSPPELGQPGKDVFGNRINVERPQRVNLNPGHNVEMREEGGLKKFFALTRGRVRHGGGRLHVDDILEINGDVDMETGSLVHPGSIIVHGDLLAGFQVEAEGDVEIHGVVEAADIHAGGNIVIAGGCSGGMGRHRIVAGGKISTRFILDAEIEAEGDVVVASEIVNAFIKCRGAVQIPDGRLTGGKTIALGGVTARDLGCERAIATTVVAGADPLLERRLADKNRALAELAEKQKKIKEATVPWLAMKDRLPPTRQQALQALLDKGRELESRRREIEAEIDQVRQQSQTRANPLIIAMGRIHSETVLQIKNARLVVNDRIVGPVRVRQFGDELRIRRIENEALDETIDAQAPPASDPLGESSQDESVA